MGMLAERIKMLRDDRGWSQTHAANLLKVHPATYSNYEQGRREPDFETVRALSRVFGCSIDYLMGETDQKERYEPSILPPGIEVVFRDITWDDLSQETKKDLVEYIRWKLAMAKNK